MKQLLLLTLLVHSFACNAAAAPLGKEYHTREYMGSVKNAQKRPIYHLINHTYTVQATIVTHGHAELLVYNHKWRLVEKYIVDDLEDLPILLRRNTLYFQAKDKRGAIVRHRQVIKPEAPLPKCICVLPPNNNCYYR